MSQAAVAPSRLGQLFRRAEFAIESALSFAVVWAFGLASAGMLIWVFAELWASPSQRISGLSLAQVRFDHSAWGLMYEGSAGAYMAIGQAAGVLLALALSLAPKPLLRRLGLVACISWAGLWAFHAVTAAIYLPTLEHLGLGLAFVVVCACAMFHSTRQWRRAGPKRGKQQG